MFKHLILLGFIAVLFVTLIKCDNTENTAYKSIKNDTLALKNTWEKAIPHQIVPEGLMSINSDQCGVCHQDHYEEWKISTHSKAWTDKQFQAELRKESSPYLCINCHIPLQNQQEYIVTGLINGDIYQPVKSKNPHFDNKLQNEGINCASCHVRDGYIIGPTGTDKAPHKTKKDTIHLSEELCISCHNAVAVVTPTLACSFETADEWKNGPYYDEKNCISCHMPELNRSIVTGFKQRKSRQHYFMGSGIPKDTSYTAKILNGYEFYPSILKGHYKLNDSLIFKFNIKNENAGHKVPTGDPERFFIINFKLLNEKGLIVNEQKERVGEEWEWYPAAKKISDNNLKPLEERSFNFNPILTKKGKFTLIIEVTKHRMNVKTAEYNKLGKDYPLFISIYKKEINFSVN